MTLGIDVFLEYAGVVAVSAGMRDIFSECAARGVAGDHGVGVAHKRLDVVFAHAVEDAARSAGALNPQDSFDLVIQGIGTTKNLSGLDDVLAVEFWLGATTGDDGVGVIGLGAGFEPPLHEIDGFLLGFGIGHSLFERFGTAF